MRGKGHVMTCVVSGRRSLVLAAIALIAALAGCAEPPPPAPPPAPPAVSLSPKLIEQASAYRNYVDRAAAISPAFLDGAAVADALKTGSTYEPQQLVRGAIAYGAVVALQDPAFVAGVRTYVQDATQRQTIAYEIMKDPAYAVGFAGSAGAAGLVMNALSDDARKLMEQGKRVTQAAYDVQRSPWSVADVPAREARLMLVKQLSATPAAGEVAQTTRLEQAVAGAAPLGLSAPAASPPYTPLVVRSLAVAALGALGYGGDANLPQLMPISAEPNAATCLNMAKLNLYQCLAVSKPYYEDVYCLGQHGVLDTSRCLYRGSGVAYPIDIRPAPLDVAAAIKATAPKGKGKAKPARKKR
jgi:hypothetical protein